MDLGKHQYRTLFNQRQSPVDVEATLMIKVGNGFAGAVTPESYPTIPIDKRDCVVGHEAMNINMNPLLGECYTADSAG